ncbi:MAG: translation initiation factor IF-2 [Clostridia bacterium]|nr:translation initiation factor IF-2 [Clostridia bacterium]
MGVKLLGKIKIYDIAKKLNLTSKKVLEVANKLKIDAKSHLSGIEEEEAERIENEIVKKETKKQGKGNVKKEKMEPKKEEKAPVIIRREVIIAEENEKAKKKEVVKKEEKKNNIGFVERKQNKDYNIVYRNKPNKPMTVSELFGLKKEEPKKEEEKVSAVEEKKVIEENKVIEEPKKQETPKPVVTKTTRIQKVEKETRPVRENRNNRENRDNRNNRNNNYNHQNSNYNNKNNNYNHQNSNYNNRNNNRVNQNNNRFNNNNNNNNRFNQNRNNNYNNNNRFGNGRRPLDEKGIEKNIKNIMSVETGEKENVREYNRGMDKQKNNNRFDENRNKKTKTRRNSQGTDFDEGKLKSLKQTNRLSNMFDEQDGGMLDYYDLTTERGRRGKRRKNQNQEERTKQKIFQLTKIEIPESITVKDLAQEMKKTTADVIKKLLGYGIMATINQEIDFDTAYLIAQEFGITASKKETVTEEDILFDDSEDREEDLQERPPVIVVMGHVDHGKTSLLDAVRKTNVIEGEAGGITQAIGAYKVKVNDREITFLDTPGHEAFTAMRARGAQITDIAILVVAANDGVKPQTVEAINHAKSAGIPIIVAINKIDLPDANIEKVKQELMTYELVPEEWGGDTIYVPISAKKGENIDQLLEMVLLEADVLELKANPNKQAKGAVIEARLDKAKGTIATMLVQRGTLDIGDTIVVGSSIGRIRAMKDDKGKSVKAAGPSTPVEIMGLTEVPEAGETFYEVKNEKMAKHLIERRKHQAREKAMNSATKVTLDNLFSQMEEGKLKVLNLIVKADVQGSVEAVKQALEKLENEEVRVKVIHAAAGAVNQSDVTLAKVSNAIIIAFNVRPDAMAKEMAEKDEVEIKQYSIIYQAIEDVEAAMKGMLEPKYEEKVIGNAEVRQTFRISNVGTIAGAYVLSGKVERNAGVRVIRENVVIHDGHLATLKRFKDDVKEVGKGFECGIQIENYNDIKEGDIIEVYIMEEIKR